MALYFPAPKWDQTSYKQGSPQFGHRRLKGARVHAACDLYATLESDVVAVDDGTVVEISLTFAGTTQAISVFHKGIGVVRYGEVVKIPEEFLKVNAPVIAGNIIGKVGRAVSSYPPMLHFELFDGTGSGSLSVRPGGKEPEHYNPGVIKDAHYNRRADLMNPTDLLDRLWLEGIK